MEKEKKERIVWIDLAKAFAILGVLVDHTYEVLYQNLIWRMSSYYSVSLFILIMGVTCYFSYERYQGKVSTKIWKDCRKMLVPYLVATLVYCLIAYRKFDLLIYLDRVIHFNISAPFYYVLLYLQLLLVMPLLFALLNMARGKRISILYEVLGFFGVIAVAWATMRYTNVLNVYGGGGKLFGGTYLILAYVGMWFAKHYQKLSAGKAWLYRVLLVVAVLATVGWRCLIGKHMNDIDALVPFGYGVNPPSISLSVYAILIACIALFLDLSIRNEKLRLPISKFSLIGRHTLYLFLWHRLILDYWLPTCFGNTILMDHIWPKRIVYYGCLILLPICIEYVAGMIGKAIGKAYGEVGKKRDE